MRRWIALLIVAAAALAPGTTGQADTRVVLRGSATPLDAPVEAVTLAGVQVGGDESRMIGWDSIKVITGDLEAEALPFLPLADHAWRARLRLSRGDLAMAEPLFESLSESFADAPGPTALMVAEGLLRCRLRRGDQAGALQPWIDAVEMRESGLRVAGDPPLIPVLDPDLLLAAALPPVWLNDGAAAAVVAAADPSLTAASDAEADSESPAEETDLAAALRTMYIAAATFEVNGTVPESLPEVDHPGAALVRQIVIARIGDAEARADARRELEAGLNDDVPWREAWRRAALGRSLLREPDNESRVRGVLQLLHLPARFSASQPYLAGVALAEASLELERMGDAEGATTLRQLLDRTDPNHPAAGWLARQRHALTTRPAPEEQD